MSGLTVRAIGVAFIEGGPVSPGYLELTVPDLDSFPVVDVDAGTWKYLPPCTGRLRHAGLSDAAAAHGAGFVALYSMGTDETKTERSFWRWDCPALIAAEPTHPDDLTTEHTVTLGVGSDGYSIMATRLSSFPIMDGP